MRRASVIVGVCIATTAVAAGAFSCAFGTRAMARGRGLYDYRLGLERQLAAAAAVRPQVVWLGDSTVLGLRDVSYPQVIARRHPELRSTVIGALGADPYFEYFAMNGVVALHPAVIVLVAHLRLFDDPRRDPARMRTTRNDLASLLPTAELPKALGLPLAERGLTIPRLLLTRSLRFEEGERALYFLEGARALVADAAWRGANEPPRRAPRLRLVTLALAASDVPVTRGHPAVRMLAASAARACEAGISVIVVATPIPFEAMRGSVGYEPALYAARFAAIGAAVEEEGAIFLDLHEALPAAAFVDPVGHFGADGAERLADLIEPVLYRELRADETRCKRIGPD